MKSFFSSRVLKFSSLMYVCALGVTTFSIPMMAVAEEACVRTSAGSVVCGTLVPKSGSNSNRIDSDTTIQTEVDSYITLELKTCVRQQQKVRCILSLKSSEDTFYGLFDFTRGSSTNAVDEQGTSYRASLIRIGKDDPQNAGIRIANGARYKTIIEFADVPVSVSQFVALNLVPTNSPYRGSKFRNVPIN